ncbi:hypothetical protein NDU88_000290 [Pleurodeles waltl]|uniref:Uncharacterized protein n=1 Tax=Pleurodeles waltl TaxID=8319 RepID=A0AAV7SW31_PLEWA|nr:hypothetical protein NDU88_000290 [Pleurodeles waltl]
MRRSRGSVIFPHGAFQTAPSQYGGRAANPAPQCPARVKCYIRGPAPAQPRAVLASPAALFHCPTGWSTPRAHRPPPAASAPPPQQGDPSEVPCCTWAVRSAPAAARGFTRGCGFRRGGGPPASSPVNQARRSPLRPPGPAAAAGAQQHPGPAPGSVPTLKLRSARNWLAFRWFLLWPLRSDGIRRAPSLEPWPRPRLNPNN